MKKAEAETIRFSLFFYAFSKLQIHPEIYAHHDRTEDRDDHPYGILRCKFSFLLIDQRHVEQKVERKLKDHHEIKRSVDHEHDRCRHGLSQHGQEAIDLDRFRINEYILVFHYLFLTLPSTLTEAFHCILRADHPDHTNEPAVQTGLP